MLITNGTTPIIVFLLVDATDHVTAETGLSPAVQLSKAGGAFASVTNAITEIANGWYKVTLTATETNADGALILRATGTGADEWRDVHEVRTSVPAAVVSMAANTLTASALATDAVTEIQSGLSTYAGGDTSGVTTLLSRLSSARAGYLDNLSAGAVALASSILDAAGIRSAVGLASANLDTQLSAVDDYLDTEIAAIKAKTDLIPASPAAIGSAMTLSNAGIDAIFDRTAGVETGTTVRESLRVMLAALVGKVSGAATTTVTIRDAADSKNRIVATVDADGNRSAVTLDKT